jgi:hypothetical protein|tara:strand:+ start:2005 stop:2115 length:111 start_codon:yes stop_codon:yes gene_type:complete
MEPRQNLVDNRRQLMLDRWAQRWNLGIVYRRIEKDA